MWSTLARIVRTPWRVTRSADGTVTGAVEVDSDFFADGNDMTYGESTNENTGWTQDWRFKEFPEGFTWTCCNGKGDKPPCIVAKHIASESAGDVVKMSSAGDED